MIAPLVLWVVITIGVSVGYLAYLSLTSAGIFGTAVKFTGLANLQSMLVSSRFWSAAGTTGLWVVGNGLVQVILAFTFARLLSA